MSLRVRPEARLVALFVGGLALCAAPAPAQQDALRPLSWLGGCWRAEGENDWSEEMWTAPGEGLLLGVSRSRSSRGRVAFEYMRIEAGPDGVIFHAAPGGGPATAFPAVAVTGERLRVERPDHDFPRAIEYRKHGADSLVARVFGEVTAADPAFALRFARVACPGGSG